MASHLDRHRATQETVIVELAVQGGNTLDTPTLRRILQRFFSNKGGNTEYYIGKCADFAWALNQYLKEKGEFYLVGKIHDKWASHIVLKWNGVYWDVRGMYPTAKEVNINTPAAQFNGDRLDRAGPSEIAHIKSLLHPDFVQDTIMGLKQAEQEMSGNMSTIRRKKKRRKRNAY